MKHHQSMELDPNKVLISFLAFHSNQERYTDAASSSQMEDGINVDKLHERVCRILDRFKRGPTPQGELAEFLSELNTYKHSSIKEKTLTTIG